MEEALSHAIYHSSSQIHEPVKATIAPEAMEIRSISGLDMSISDEELAIRGVISSIYGNRELATS